jgi:hypothetical protein
MPRLRTLPKLRNRTRPETTPMTLETMLTRIFVGLLIIVAVEALTITAILNRRRTERRRIRNHPDRDPTQREIERAAYRYGG